jgi:quinoprotein dehydrogenase-associated probable ABC transporter substrate-binding protein
MVKGCSRRASLFALLGALTASVSAQGDEGTLKVCSDANNLPLSHANGEGYENKIAAEIARDLGRRLEYTYFPQRMGFVRNTLRKQDPTTREYACDLIIGVPAGYELTATTKPYMRSTYAIVFPVVNGLENVHSPEDLLSLPEKELHTLRIGVFAQSPGADWLLRNRLLQQAVSYAQQSGDPNENPNSIIERELTSGNIDAAIVWGPIAAHLVRKHSGSPDWRAVAFVGDRQIKFDYDIAMGVRFGEKEWKATIEDWIAKHRSRIDEILVEYGIPLVDDGGNLVSDFRTDAGGSPSGSVGDIASLKAASSRR